MGQYQQWLHYREVDQHLRAQLETLERELVQLQEHARLLEQSIQPLYTTVSPETSSPGDQDLLQTDNQIIHVLADGLNGQLSPMVSITGDTCTSIPTSLPGTVPDQPVETISLALFGWSNLPNFGPQEVAVETFTTGNASLFSNTEQSLPSLPPIPHSDAALLPEDILAFFDQHDHTEPQLEIPRWLHNVTNHSGGPIDQETVRTNRLVQRWAKRWNRHPSSQQNQGGTTHE